MTCVLNPNSISPLYANGWNFRIHKVPELTFHIQTVAFPGLSLPAAQTGTPYSDIFWAGDKISFDQLQIEFLVDENAENYRSLFTWLRALGAPQNSEAYKQFLNFEKNKNLVSNNAKMVSDATLALISPANEAVLIATFTDCVPVSLGGMQLNTTTDTTPVIQVSATFAYTYFDIMTP